MTFANFYVIAPVEMLEVPIDMELFTAVDESEVEYQMTIPQWCSSIGHKAPRENLDGTTFVKGFPFTYAGMFEFTTKAQALGLTVGTNLFVFNQAEIGDMLATGEWTQVETA